MFENTLGHEKQSAVSFITNHSLPSRIPALMESVSANCDNAATNNEQRHTHDRKPLKNAESLAT